MIWFEPFINDWTQYGRLSFDPGNQWFKKHIELFQNVKKPVGNDFYIGIPDIMENIDVLASMRGAQDTIFDIIDQPEEILRRIQEINDI